MLLYKQGSKGNIYVHLYSGLGQWWYETNEERHLSSNACYMHSHLDLKPIKVNVKKNKTENRSGRIHLNLGHILDNTQDLGE